MNLWPRFWLCLALGLLLIFAACSSIDYSRKPPEDWPKLTVIEHYGQNPRDYCAAPFFLRVLACTKPNFAQRTCDIYFSAWKKEEVDDWLRKHELAHCAGYDHYDDTSMADEWNASKAGHSK